MSELDHSEVPRYAELLRLAGKAYIVLGAGQGMGRQTAHALAEVGAQVCCVDIDAERAEHVAAEVKGVACAADATQRDEVERVVAETGLAFGRLDGFVDIIGIAEWAGVLKLQDATWDSQFDLCLRHAYLISQIAGRRMVADSGGTMVFIASVSGMTGAPRHAAYGAAKAGLMAWVRSLSVELGPKGIRANAVAPGWIRTPRMEQQFTEQELQAKGVGCPLGRVGRPHEIAAAALFLSSELSSFINGQTLVVDGGVNANFPYAK